MMDTPLMMEKYNTVEQFQVAYPWGSKWETSQTPRYKCSRGRVVGWIWTKDSYGVILDNDKWDSVRSYSPSLVWKKRGKKK